MRKSEYEAMLIDDQGIQHDPAKLDTGWKVMKALEEMDKGKKVEGEPEKKNGNPLLSWLLQKRRI
ncbi:hypothetical protein [Proteiniclasticum sp.]|uniref:hypothetical protein n=1 Tax=Proteiniclasticum sp. TaxID=2053595 RepID=UPI00289E9A73|nr:hypothetical protein [Proteiniclasticum sp.]